MFAAVSGKDSWLLFPGLKKITADAINNGDCDHGSGLGG
jgi:hypothetical protein